MFEKNMVEEKNMVQMVTIYRKFIFNYKKKISANWVVKNIIKKYSNDFDINVKNNSDNYHYNLSLFIKNVNSVVIRYPESNFAKMVQFSKISDEGNYIKNNYTINMFTNPWNFTNLNSESKFQHFKNASFEDITILDQFTIILEIFKKIEIMIGEVKYLEENPTEIFTRSDYNIQYSPKYKTLCQEIIIYIKRIINFWSHNQIILYEMYNTVPKISPKNNIRKRSRSPSNDKQRISSTDNKLMIRLFEDKIEAMKKLDVLNVEIASCVNFLDDDIGLKKISNLIETKSLIEEQISTINNNILLICCA